MSAYSACVGDRGWWSECSGDGLLLNSEFFVSETSEPVKNHRGRSGMCRIRTCPGSIGVQWRGNEVTGALAIDGSRT